VIRIFRDQDEDMVAVDMALVAGISIGDVTGPRPAETPVRVTLIWLRGIAQPFMVADDFEHVVAVWEAERRDAQEMGGWKFHPVVTGSAR
jgi:hypothetical protein